MSVVYKDESKRLSKEFEQLASKNVALYKIVSNLSAYLAFTLRKPTVLTCVHRTVAEQEKIYGKGTKKKSPHMLWTAVDLRSRIYESREIDFISAALRRYDEFNEMREMKPSKSKTVLYHEVGNNGIHFHIQYTGPVVGSQFRSDRVSFDELWRQA